MGEAGELPEVGAGALAAEVKALRRLCLENKDGIASILEYLETVNVGGPWHWENLDTFQRIALMNELVEFVEWLHERYLQYVTRYALPACWYKHPPAVSQLTALMVAHKAAYNKGETAASGALVEWHERALWPVLEHMFKYEPLNNCLAAHKEDRTKPTLKRTKDLEQLLEYPTAQTDQR